VTSLTQLGSAIGTARLVHDGSVSAAQAVDDALEAQASYDPAINSFTLVLAESARAQAASIDALLKSGADPGPLAGVPFAVKNLFDIAGVVTTAGSKIHGRKGPAYEDAAAVARLKAAGAVLIGALNMDEYAYGFTTENSHFGPTRNPHDPSRIAGGSSGGSAAAVAGGLVPLTLASDTNGSIRVPSALCGVFGLKPTYGAISRAGTVPFVPSLDHIGPIARSVRDLAMVFDILNGPDPRDPACGAAPGRAVSGELTKGTDGLRIAVAGGYFKRQALQEAFDAVALAANALEVNREVTLPEAERARAAAYLITACEGGNQHLPNLRARPHDFDALTVERLMAGALLPAAWYVQAQRFRSWFRERIREVFETVDVILAPATPCAATLIGQEELILDGVAVPLRPTLGLFTQPLSFIGLPIVCAPIHGVGSLPLGVQLIAAPHQEAKALRVAYALERIGIASAPVVRPAEAS
jgi:AtzE family amidohydrolase